MISIRGTYMTLIRMSEQEWVLVDDGIRMEGDKEFISDALILRLAKLLSLFSYTGGDDAVAAARSEVAFAFECMRREGHNMADFGVAGHFIRTMTDVRMAS
jgi:hypothetical protein